MYPAPEHLSARAAAGYAVAARDNEDAIRASSVQVADDGYRGIRIAIWVYFWLLLFEGALRKWAFPGSSNMLLLVRDPVVVVCYLIALKNGKFPTDGFSVSALILGVLSFMVSLVASQLHTMQQTVLATSFGFHANFLHLPLIALIRNSFDKEQILKFGKWTLYLAAPMALLVFFQYRAGSEAWVNKGAGKGSSQMWIGVGDSEKIRPAGLFSYGTGLASYLSWVAAFMLNAVLVQKVLTKKMLAIAAASLAVAGTLAVSRTCALSIVLVFAGGVLCSVLAPKLATRSILIAGLCGVLYFVVSKVSVLGEGLAFLQQRVTESEGLKVGGLDRFLDGFVEPFRALDRASFLGAGLGMGTNAVGSMLTGERAFLLGTETEWARHILESGPVLGGLFILLRVVLFWQLISVSLAALKRLNPLPMLLFSTCFILVLLAPIGIPMSLGFVVMSAGMAFAAAKDTVVPIGESVLMEMKPERKPVARGRSPYAERLHAGKRV